MIGDASKIGYVAEGLREALSAKLFQLKRSCTWLASDGSVEIDMNDVVATNREGTRGKYARGRHGTRLLLISTLRVTVKLDDVAENRVLWNKEFSGVPGDLLTMEDKIYGELTEMLETNSSAVDSAAGTAHPTDNVDAYDSYLRGRNAMRGQLNPKSIQSAMDDSNAALRKDPKFALAYAGLADASLRVCAESKDSFWTEEAVNAGGAGSSPE